MLKEQVPEVSISGCAHSLLVVLLVFFLDLLGGRDVALYLRCVVIYSCESYFATDRSKQEMYLLYVVFMFVCYCETYFAASQLDLIAGLKGIRCWFVRRGGKA